MYTYKSTEESMFNIVYKDTILYTKELLTVQLGLVQYVGVLINIKQFTHFFIIVELSSYKNVFMN